MDLNYWWGVFFGLYLSVAWGISKCWYSDQLWNSLQEEQSLWLYKQSEPWCAWWKPSSNRGVI